MSKRLLIFYLYSTFSYSFLDVDDFAPKVDYTLKIVFGRYVFPRKKLQLFSVYIKITYKVFNTTFILSMFTSNPTTVKFHLSSSLVIADGMPPLAPVTTATFPANLSIFIGWNFSDYYNSKLYLLVALSNIFMRLVETKCLFTADNSYKQSIRHTVIIYGDDVLINGNGKLYVIDRWTLLEKLVFFHAIRKNSYAVMMKPLLLMIFF